MADIEHKGILSKDEVLKIAAGYSNRNLFYSQEPVAFQSAVLLGCLDAAMSHMKAGKWHKEMITSLSKCFPSLSEFAAYQNGLAYHAARRHGWLDDACKHVRWNRKNVANEAAKYECKSDFRNFSKPAYLAARRHGWLDEVCSHMSRKPKDTLWTKEAVLVEAAKYDHKSDFSKANRSAYLAALQYGWLDEVCSHMSRKRPQNLWTDKEIITAEAAKYKSRSEFRRNNGSAYIAALRYGCIDEVCKHMPKRQAAPKPRKWSKNMVVVEAAKYRSIGDFSKGSPSAYFAARRYGWLEDCEWMTVPQRKSKWTYEAVSLEAAKYETKGDFSKDSPGAYSAALRYGWLDEFNWRKCATPIKWTKEMVLIEAAKFSMKSDFAKDSPGAYSAALRYGWLEDSDWETAPPSRKSKWTKEKVSIEAKKYNRRGHFQKENPSAYNYARRQGYLDEICSHMRVFLSGS